MLCGCGFDCFCLSSAAWTNAHIFRAAQTSWSEYLKKVKTGAFFFHCLLFRHFTIVAELTN